jgi:selenide, water dikinase
VSTAVKQGAAPASLVETAIDVMTRRNADAADAAGALGAAVHAATDVTGFGLLGHLRELLVASGVAATIDGAAVPVLEGVRALLAAGMVAGGTRRNRDFVSEAAPVDWGALPEAEQLLLADAQTSGGLLLAVDADRARDLVTGLSDRGALAAAVVGTVTDGPAGAIEVR